MPESALAGVGERPFGFYVHVPFCTVRCGYCDFNTYTAAELGGPDAALACLDHLRRTADLRRRQVASARSRTPY